MTMTTTIKSNELRVGNWVICDPYTEITERGNKASHCGHLGKVSGIQTMGDKTLVFVNDNLFAPLPLDKIRGVPLVSALLCFDFSSRQHSDGDYHHTLIKNKDIGLLERPMGCYYLPGHGGVGSVHTLQNVLWDWFKQDVSFDCLYRADVDFEVDGKGDVTNYSISIR